MAFKAESVSFKWTTLFWSWDAKVEESPYCCPSTSAAMLGLLERDSFRGHLKIQYVSQGKRDTYHDGVIVITKHVY